MKIKVSRKFASDFEIVTDHYGFTAEEKEEAKQAARNDIENAEICFSEIAKDILYG